MKHFATAKFWRCCRALPMDVQELADRCFSLLKSDSAHASLHFKRVGSLWSVRVGLHYRALATDGDADGEVVWFWVGTHADYDKLVGRKAVTRSPKASRRTTTAKSPRTRRRE